MNSKKIFLMTILLVLLSTSLVVAARPEPTGFRNIKWETNFEEVKDQLTQTRAERDTVYYSRANDELKIGGADLQSIEYIFWQNKFYGVYIKFKDPQNFFALQKALESNYGIPYQPNRYLENHIWRGFKNTTMYLQFNVQLMEGVYSSYSDKIERDKDKLEQEQAKNAKKDL